MVLTNNQYFADGAAISSLLKIGTGSDTVDFSESDLDVLLPIIQGEVHDFLKAQDLVTTVPITSTQQGFYTVKSVLVQMINVWNSRRQKNKITIQSEGSDIYLNSPVFLDDTAKIHLSTAFRVTDDESVDTIPTYKSHYDTVY